MLFWGVGTTFGRLIWATFAAISPLTISYIHPPTLYSSARCTLAAYSDKIDCYWGFFLRLYISLDRFILFVIRSHCAPSSGGRRSWWWCSFKWFTRKAVFVLDAGKMQKWKKMQSQGVLWQVTKYTFACNICHLKTWLQHIYMQHATYVAWKASHSWGLLAMYISPVWEGHHWLKYSEWHLSPISRSKE